MKYDFGQDGEQLEDFTTVPPGIYLCRIDEVRPGTTRQGDDRWGLRLVVAEGEFVGRQAAWDGVTFSNRARSRLRRIFGALGLPTEGEIDLEPSELVGRQAFVDIRAEVNVDSRTNTKIRRNQVTYDGWAMVRDELGRPVEQGTPSGTDDLPF